MIFNIIINNVRNLITVVEKWLKDSETKLRIKEDYVMSKVWRPERVQKQRLRKVGKLIEIEVGTEKEKTKENYRIGCFGRYKANKNKSIKYPGIISMFMNLFQF